MRQTHVSLANARSRLCEKKTINNRQRCARNICLAFRMWRLGSKSTHINREITRNFLKQEISGTGSAANSTITIAGLHGLTTIWTILTLGAFYYCHIFINKLKRNECNSLNTNEDDFDGYYNGWNQIKSYKNSFKLQIIENVVQTDKHVFFIWNWVLSYEEETIVVLSTQQKI